MNWNHVFQNFEKLQKIEKFSKYFLKFFFVFLVIFLETLFFILLTNVWLSNILNPHLFVHLFLSPHAKKNDNNLKKIWLYLFKILIGSFCATCIIIGLFVFHAKSGTTNNHLT